MPRMDRTGPWGTGPMTGRGMGPCGGGYGRNRGKVRSRSRMMGGWFNRSWTGDDEKTALDSEEKWLEQELDAVRKERAALKGQKS